MDLKAGWRIGDR